MIENSLRVGSNFIDYMSCMLFTGVVELANAHLLNLNLDSSIHNITFNHVHSIPPSPRPRRLHTLPRRVRSSECKEKRQHRMLE